MSDNVEKGKLTRYTLTLTTLSVPYLPEEEVDGLFVGIEHGLQPRGKQPAPQRDAR